MDETRRILAMVLCLVMLIGIVPAGAFAAEGEIVAISVTPPAKTEYLVGEELDPAGMVVTATYADGTTGEITGYLYSEPDLSEAGTHIVTVTLPENETVYAEFTVTAVHSPEEPVEEEPAEEPSEAPSVPGETGEPEIPGIFSTGAVTVSANWEDIPAPVTYEDAHDMTTVENRTVFIPVESAPGVTTGVYLHASSESLGEVNLLAAARSGIGNVKATVESGIRGDGTAFVYIGNPDKTAIWEDNANAATHTFYNAELTRYLRYSNGLTTTGSSWQASTWNSGDAQNMLYYRSGNRQYYIGFSNGTWSARQYNINATKPNVYGFVRTTLDMQVTTRHEGVHSIAGAPSAVAAAAIAGRTVTLSSVVNFVNKSDELLNTITDPAGVAYEIYDNTSGIIDSISGNVVTLSGNTGSALVKISFNIHPAEHEGDTDKIITNYIEITAQVPQYKLALRTRDGAHIEEVPAAMQIQHSTADRTVTLDLTNTAFFYTESHGGIVELNPALTWTLSENTNGATLANGMLTMGTNPGKVTVNVSCTYEGVEYKDSLTLDVVKDVWGLELHEPVYTPATQFNPHENYFTLGNDGYYKRVINPVEADLSSYYVAVKAPVFEKAYHFHSAIEYFTNTGDAFIPVTDPDVLQLGAYYVVDVPATYGEAGSWDVNTQYYVQTEHGFEPVESPVAEDFGNYYVLETSATYKQAALLDPARVHFAKDAKGVFYHVEAPVQEDVGKYYTWLVEPVFRKAVEYHPEEEYFALTGTATEVTLPEGADLSLYYVEHKAAVYSPAVKVFSENEQYYTYDSATQTYTPVQNPKAEELASYYFLASPAIYVSANHAHSGETDPRYYTLSSIGYAYIDDHDLAEVEEHLEHLYVQNTLPINRSFVIKNAQAGTEHDNLWAVITQNGTSIGALDATPLEPVDGQLPTAPEKHISRLVFSSSDENIAKVDPSTGIITFQGVNGTVRITATYRYGADNTDVVSDTVTFIVSTDAFVRPEDGTSEGGIDDFPEFPDEGAIRFDKNATAVGNFSRTGVVKVELSMTGVPFRSNAPTDLVVMVDMTRSMSANDVSAAKQAVKQLLASAVYNETQDAYDSNIRLFVYTFSSGSSDASVAVTQYLHDVTICNNTDLTTAQSAIDGFNTNASGSGTRYNVALRKVRELLNREGHADKQFVVFVSDGEPSAYTTMENGAAGETIEDYVGEGWFDEDNNWALTGDFETEFNTYLIKSAGIPVYTVGANLDVESVAGQLLSHMSSNYTPDGLHSTGESQYFFTCETSRGITQEVLNIFKGIGESIREAAKDVAVVDEITSEYSMIFDAPNATVDDADGNQQYYIDVVEYNLDPVVENGEIVNYLRNTTNPTTKMRLYLGTADGNYYAATAAGSTGGANAFAAPVFNRVPQGTRFYWTTEASLCDSGVQITVGGVTYYFVKHGKSGTATDWPQVSGKWYNLASGAYVQGAPTSVDCYRQAGTSDSQPYYVKDESGNYTQLTTPPENGVVYYVRETTTTCNDLVIATPYFVYNAATRTLVWTAEKLSSTELALSYFLYLNRSGGHVGSDDEMEAGTYETNVQATISYINVNGKPCQDEFPVPQMTWNGAQVSYVFYLVNHAGQPVNRAGRVVPFSEAVYVTDVFYQEVVWNDLQTIHSLDADYLAGSLVPDVYELYDHAAGYNIHVFEDETGYNLNNHFIIKGAADKVNTTHVFNTKADSQMYTAPGTYAAQKNYLCRVYEEEWGSYEADAFLKREDNTIFEETDATGKYRIVEKKDAEETATGFDFSNTTVAFAVMWKKELVPDTVVIDFGLDVVVDVVENDALASGVVGVRTDAPDANINTGDFTAMQQQSASLYIYKKAADFVSGTTYYTRSGDTYTEAAALNGFAEGTEYYVRENLATASLEETNKRVVRVSLDKQNGMLVKDPLVFYYESAINYYDHNTDGSLELKTENRYSSLTVIPATTVYYEDEYVTLKTYSKYAPATVESEAAFAGGTYYTKDPDTGVYVQAAQYSAGTAYFTIAEDYREIDGWDTNSVAAYSSQTQQVDRPGEDRIGGNYDADNIYGYDPIYENSSVYSLGSAAQTRVFANKYATAEFEFYGTGFDIISMTSNTTGTIIVRIYPWNGTDYSADPVKSHIVDTYFGYSYGKYLVTYTYNPTSGKWDRLVGEASAEELREADFSDTSKTVTAVEMAWKVSKGNPEGLYQVPVIKVNQLTYGRYKAVITASYSPVFDHEDTGNYDFYMDAIRIYDPCGTTNGTANDAYGSDGEYAPSYVEVRNKIIATSTIGAFFTEVTGISQFEEGTAYYFQDDGAYTVAEQYTAGTRYYTMNPGVVVDGAAFLTSTFIDGNAENYSISEYTNFGPNNEVYLAKEQAVAAKLTAAEKSGYTPHIYLGIKSVGGNADVEVYSVGEGGSVDTMAVQENLTTATDLYYDITALNGRTFVIRNSGTEGILSITNVKVAYEKNESETPGPATVNASGDAEEDVLFTVDSDTLRLALLSLRPPVEQDQPEGNVPGGDPEGNEPGGEPEGNEPGAGESKPEESQPEESKPEESKPEEPKPEAPKPGKPGLKDLDLQPWEDLGDTIWEIIEIIRDMIGIIGGFFSGWF